MQAVPLSVAFFENIDNFRKVKEHRSDLPLVSIALVIDEFGFPLDYEIYSGCGSEFRFFPKNGGIHFYHNVQAFNADSRSTLKA